MAGAPQSNIAARICPAALHICNGNNADIPNSPIATLQLHRGHGDPLKWIARDLRVHRILEGANEIMRAIIAREVFY